VTCVLRDGIPLTFTDLQSQLSLRLFTPLSWDDVIKLILSVPSSLDPTPTWLLKDCVDLLSPYLTHLFNTSLSSGCVPDLFKVAYITPLLKKPGSDVDATENYRPVSNLPVLSKTLERAVSQQMESYLSAAGLLPHHQSVYRKGHSRETALVKVCSDLISMMDSGEQALLALLDLSSAFDTVDHDILLTRLSRSFRVCGDVLSWMRSYLSGRTYTVRIGGTESSSRGMLCGVPQGPVLGPLLFILYSILPISVASRIDMG